MPSSGVTTSGGGHVASGVIRVFRVTARAGRAEAEVAFIYSIGGCLYF